MFAHLQNLYTSNARNSLTEAPMANVGRLFKVQYDRERSLRLPMPSRRASAAHWH